MTSHLPPFSTGVNYLKDRIVSPLTPMHIERPKLHQVLAILRAKGLRADQNMYKSSRIRDHFSG